MLQVTAKRFSNLFWCLLFYLIKHSILTARANCSVTLCCRSCLHLMQIIVINFINSIKRINKSNILLLRFSASVLIDS